MGKEKPETEQKTLKQNDPAFEYFIRRYSEMKGEFETLDLKIKSVFTISGFILAVSLFLLGRNSGFQNNIQTGVIVTLLVLATSCYFITIACGILAFKPRMVSLGPELKKCFEYLDSAPEKIVEFKNKIAISYKNSEQDLIKAINEKNKWIGYSFKSLSAGVLFTALLFFLMLIFKIQGSI